MSLNPSGSTAGSSWNYSDPSKDGFSESITGTIVAIQEVQAREYTTNGQPGAPKFWPEGKPVWNHRIAMVVPDGTIKTFTYTPASKAAKEGKKRSIHLDLFALTGNTDMSNLLGKTITLTTKSLDPNGQKISYFSGNPRPFEVALSQEGPFILSGPLPAEYTVPQVLADAAASGGQMVAPQAQPVQPVQQAQPAQPVLQAQPVQTIQPVQPVQQAAPAGMDPSIAATMQQTMAAAQQQASSYDPVYQDGIPF